MKQTLQFFRKFQMVFSIIVFFIVFFICYFTTGFSITEIQLSKWGITEQVSWLWNSCLVMLGMSCFFNIYHYIKLHSHLNFKKQFLYLFLFQCINIMFLGLVVSGSILHNIVAYIYFFTLPLSIYLFAFLNKNRMLFNEWIKHTILSSLMMGLPLITFFIFPGKAISEILHSLIFIIWNIYILKDNTL